MKAPPPSVRTLTGTPFLIVDEFDAIWDVLTASKPADDPKRRVDIILDNSGITLCQHE